MILLILRMLAYTTAPLGAAFIGAEYDPVTNTLVIPIDALVDVVYGYLVSAGVFVSSRYAKVK